MAFGYKPRDLIHVYAQDVLDWKRGLESRYEYDTHILYTAAEIAAGRRDRPSKNKARSKYSQKFRDLIAQEDRKDKEKGKIK